MKVVTIPKRGCPENQGGKQGEEGNYPEDDCQALPGKPLGMAECGKLDCGGDPLRRACTEKSLHQPYRRGASDEEQTKGKQGSGCKQGMAAPVEMGTEKQHAEDYGE